MAEGEAPLQTLLDLLSDCAYHYSGHFSPMPVGETEGICIHDKLTDNTIQLPVDHSENCARSTR
jgi:hypothetical protein